MIDEATQPCVHDEFGTLESAVVWGGSRPEHIAIETDSSADEVHELMKEFAVPKIHQHFQFIELLTRHGVKIVHPHHSHCSLKKHGVVRTFGVDPYCRDFIGVTDGTVYRTNQQTWRMDQKLYHDRIVQALGPSIKDLDILFSWGNAILDKEELLVGRLSDESLGRVLATKDAAERAEALSFFDDMCRGLQTMSHACSRNIETIILRQHTDLDFAIAPLPQRKHEKRTVLVQAEVMSEKGMETLLKRFDRVAFIPDEERKLGANLLWLNPETVLVAEEARDTARLLEKMKYDVKRLPMWSIWESEDSPECPGGWRCCIAPLRRKNDY